MSSFTTPLIVSPMSDGSSWKLESKFTYHIGSKFSRHFISVPKGFITDFASIPNFLFFLPDWATYNKAPVLHDYIYATHRLHKEWTRQFADDIFLEAMLVDFRDHKSGPLVAWLEYYAVRLFGWIPWNKY
jgi:hypothetical protein